MLTVWLTDFSLRTIDSSACQCRLPDDGTGTEVYVKTTDV
jgi:hypothetical protein